MMGDSTNPREGCELLSLVNDGAPESVLRVTSAQAKAVAAAPVHILVVDDDAGARSAMDTLLRSAGFVTSTAVNGEAALHAARDTPPDFVLTDLEMPLVHGAELCRRLREIHKDLQSS